MKGDAKVMPEGRQPVDPVATRAAAASIFVECFAPVLTDIVRRAHPMGLHQFQLIAHDGANLAPGLAEDDPRMVLASAFVDVGGEPVVLRLPNTHGRYFNLTLIDAAGEPFDSLGARTGDAAGVDLALVGPEWRGEIPRGVRARRTPCASVWAVGRIHAQSKLDRAETVDLAERLSVAVLQPEPIRGRPSRPVLEPPPSPSLRQVAELAPATFFHRLELVLARTPAAYQSLERPVIDGLLKALGGPPDRAAWTQDLAEALARGFADGLEAIRAAAATSSGAEGGGWRSISGALGESPAAALARAARAYVSLGAPGREDVLALLCDRDETGRPLSSASGYRIHFAADELPPVNAFWRLTVRPGDSHGALGVGDRSQLTLNPDGSCDIHIQQSPPPLEQLPNWLATPDGPFSLVVRLYSPRPAALSGAWRMPPVQRLDPGASAARAEPIGSAIDSAASSGSVASAGLLTSRTTP